ncbi:LytTR family transcriptional regulator (plasmid) [Runella rosea]|uniref:LytTR family transcriptional regulator n=1 Tax=Runella rosea TaxID=2259595 RepID=A0A344TTM3_9BACT|nr:LytTR family DNA-binding domain-containing protein [Runella rosea]AXE21994.1 LytTR family transcriptional regulator [Runella rosea]
MNPILFLQESAVQLPRFHTKAGEQFIDLVRIVYLKAQLNYTVFQLSDGEQVVTSLSLGSYAALLESQGFIRIHKSYLLNLHYLQQCSLKPNHQLVLPDGKRAVIARRRRSMVKKIIK